MIKESWNLIGPEAHLDTLNQEWKSYVLPSLDDYLYPKKSKMSIGPFQWHCWSKNCTFWLVERHNWPQPTKSGSLRSYLSLTTNSMQKTKILIDSFQRNWWSKNPVIQMGRRLNWLHPTKSGGPRCFLSLMYNLMYNQRILQYDWTRGYICLLYDVNWFLPEILMVTKYCNLIAWEHFRS